MVIGGGGEDKARGGGEGLQSPVAAGEALEGERKAEIKEDDKDMEKEPSGSNKKVSDWILKENY
jgi:hypothetical protein